MKRYTALIDTDTDHQTKKSKKCGGCAIQQKSDSNLSSSYGVFEFVPFEVRLHILSYLTITDLGILSLVSKSSRSLVEELYSYRAHSHFPYRTLHTVVSDEQKMVRNERYKQIGTMLKRVTCTYSTATRIRTIESYLQDHLCFKHDLCVASSQCCALTSFGYLIKTFSNGWLAVEHQRLFHTLVHSCFNSNNFWLKLTRLTTSSPGAHPDDEFQTRLFLRRLFIDPHGENTEMVAASLSRILGSWPIVQRARILFILYGPVHRNRLMWSAMCQNTAADGDQVRTCFGELGWAISSLRATNHWKDDDAISVMDELTSMPDDWLAENVACLLHTMGLPLAASVVISKAVNGQCSDLAVTLTSMSLVAVKLRCSLNPILLLIEKACEATRTDRNRRIFLDQLARSFQDVIVDLYEANDIDNRIDDFSTLLKAQAFFLRALLGRVYEE